jgi:glyoxylase-like metal-dependent hydrolase (beta-lactamase superfamily II)
MTELSRRAVLTAGAVGAAALASGVFPAVAAAPPAGKQAPGYYRFKVGDYEVTVLNDGVLKFPLQAIRVPAEEVNAALEAAFLPKGDLLAPFNVTMVNTGSKLVLIDTGNGSGRAPTVGLVPSNLTAAGVDPKDVDIVVISHFHGDHIGGLVNAQGVPNYPNAEIKVPVAEWTFWMSDENMQKAPQGMQAGFQNVRRVFGALGDKVTRYEAGKEVAPGITALDTPGHTPGHTSYVVASGSGKLLVQSDITAVVATLIIERPNWAIGGDMNAAQATETRKKVYDMVAAERMPLTGYHLPFPAVGYVEKNGSGYRYVPAMWNVVL